MALKAVDQIRFDSLQETAKMLMGLGYDQAKAKEAMAPQVKAFEDASQHKVSFAFSKDKPLALTDLRKDFLRTRLPNEESLVLKAKVEGVPIDVKLLKAGDYEFTNDQVVSALRALADAVTGLTVELSTLGYCDLDKMGDSEDKGVVSEDEEESADKEIEELFYGSDENQEPEDDSE